MQHQLLREVNERIHSLSRRLDGPGRYLCECGCCDSSLVIMEVTRFADLVAVPGLVLVAQGHVPPGCHAVRVTEAYTLCRRDRDA